MKSIYKILIVFSFILSLYAARGDIMMVINKIPSVNRVISYNKSQFIKLVETEVVPIVKKSEIPGPLRVVSDYLKGNTSLDKNNVIKITNKYRKENGNLGALVDSPKLDLSAQKKLKDMFDGQYFEHVSPSGLSVGDLGGQVGYEYILIGENLALGNFKNDLGLVDAWMASPGHRANILNTHYTEIGVAVGKGKYEGKNVWIAVQHFGTPKSICPEIDQSLRNTIEMNRIKIKNMENDFNIRKSNLDLKSIIEGNTYFEQINKYNNLIEVYNKLSADTKQEVDDYNVQIAEFNLCLANNQ
ncbi:MAG: CAP domain-containing protein [Candidatus Nomurabacteria bacterium]|nr:CAP domain-containing protein [Candidatus Nomurabacteria bacterium]